MTLALFALVQPAQARPWGPPPGRIFIATLETSLGNIRCMLRHETAPETVRAFVELARGKRAWTDPVTGAQTRRPLYDGTIFHRVIPEFMIQGGDPLGDGTGGPGYTLPDEAAATSRFDRSGMLAMANHGPDTGGSQFFITEVPVPYLDGKHTVFGECGNEEVIRRIAGTARDQQDRPNTPVVLKKVTITVE